MDNNFAGSQAPEQSNFTKFIENEVALGKLILDVDSFSAKEFVLVPVLENEKVIGYKIQTGDTPFKEPLTTDLTKANLDTEDLSLARAILELYFLSKSHAERYNKQVDVAQAGNLLVDLLNGLVISSRARDFRGAILAKSSISVHEAKQRQQIIEGEEGGGKPFWKFW